MLTSGKDAPQVLAVAALRKEYGGKAAVDGISFGVGRGEIVGLLGPNGAGKTPTINMLLGVLEPTSGTIGIEGVDLARHRSQALSRTNFAAVYAPLPGNLTVFQNLRVFGLIYGVKDLKARIEVLLGECAPDARPLVWGAGLALLYIVLACAFFTRVFRQAVRTGLLARYSAESVS